MKSYPKIEHYNKAPFGEHCYAFYKHDGSNFRAEWGRKRGWYKWGTRNVMIDKNTPFYGEAIDIFLNKYGQNLDDVFRIEYPKVDSFVVFGEFLGPNSFAGKHVETDNMDVIIFDVNQHKRGFLPPKEFIENFGHLDIPKIIYQGEYNHELIKKVKANQFGLEEGVVCKGVIKTKKEGEVVWMNKIKTNQWIEKVKILYGEKALIEEFNSDSKILKEYEY
jgi:hypothetical protein